MSDALDEVPAGRKGKVAAEVVSKGHFLDILKGAKVPAQTSSQVQAQTSWLAQGFMMGARMKDWDKEEEQEVEEVDDEAELEAESE